MCDFLKELIKSVGGFAVAVGAAAWLLRSIILHFLNKDIEAYKSRLSAETTREVEHLKANLQIVAKEHEVRFADLQGKRAQIISELYSLLDDADFKTGLFVSFQRDGSTELRKHWQESYNACVELFCFFRRNRLFFSRALVDKMGGLIEGLIEPSEEWIPTLVGNGEHQEEYSKVMETWHSKRAEIAEASRMLEEEFRKLLGSER